MHRWNASWIGGTHHALMGCMHDLQIKHRPRRHFDIFRASFFGGDIALIYIYTYFRYFPLGKEEPATPLLILLITLL